MTTLIHKLLIPFIVFGLSTTVTAEKKNDPSGTWRWEYDWNGEMRKDALIINLEKDGKLSGQYVGTNQKVKIKEGKFEKAQLSVTIELDYEGTPIELNFAGKVDGDKIDGNVTGEAGGGFEFPWAPTRSVIADDVVGKWKFQIDTQNGTLEPTMVLTKQGDKLKAVYTSQAGKGIDVSKLKLEKNLLSFSIATDFNGSDLTADYKGRPYGDKIAGDLTYNFDGQTGELEFTGKREVEKKKAEKSAK